jgi:hypothetical protein
MGTFGTYCRLGVHVAASNLSVIRAARRMLREGARRAREHRAARHAFYRQMMEYHASARDLVADFRL